MRRVCGELSWVFFLVGYELPREARQPANKEDEPTHKANPRFTLSSLSFQTTAIPSLFAKESKRVNGVALFVLSLFIVGYGRWPSPRNHSAPNHSMNASPLRLSWFWIVNEERVKIFLLFDLLLNVVNERNELFSSLINWLMKQWVRVNGWWLGSKTYNQLLRN